MESRRMNTIGLDMPILGMGLMRLPMKDGQIDEAHAINMVDTFYNAGVRYFDTAYVYGDGQSERFAKVALTDRYPRDSFYLATKIPPSEDMIARKEEVFAESCARMGVDYIDFYLLHALNASRWELAKEKGLDKWQRQLKAEGKVKYVGFSFHDSPEALRKILADQPDWDFVQIQFNYLDWYSDCAEELYNILAERNIPIVVMEPVRGGTLVEQGDDIRQMLLKADPNASNAEWAMRWVASHPAINVILSGVSNIDQAEENARIFNPLVPLTDEQEQTVKAVVDTIMSRPHVPCTGCNYCKDCPAGIPIPRIFHASNAHTRLGVTDWFVHHYFNNTPEENRATACLGCRACVEHCPQSIDIPAELAKCHELLSSLHSK